MANFQDILQKTSAEVEAPKAMPVGTYLCIIDGPPEITKRGKNGTECIIFKMKPMQAQGDVSQEELQAFLKGRSLSEFKIENVLWGTNDPAKEDNVKWRLKQFLDNCGIEEGTKSLGERVSEAMGKQVLINMGARPSEDGTQIFAEVKGSAKV